MRVHELAKKLNMSNKDLLDKLKAAGMDVKTHSSGIDEGEAMSALQGGGAKMGAPKRRRMVIRRRKPSADSAEVVAEETVPESSSPVATETADLEVGVQEHQLAENKESRTALDGDGNVDADAGVSAGGASDSAAVAPEAQSTLRPESKIDGRVSAVAGSSSEEQNSQAATPAEAPKPEVEPSAKVAAPKNVVRRIDPDAIKNRLAAEGRDFRPRPKRGRVRELKVVGSRFGAGPQMVDVSNQSNPGGGPRSGKKKSTGGFDYKERREMRSSRDFWQNPGRKRKTGKKGKGPEITQAAAHKRVIEMKDAISVSDLSHQMSVKGGQVVGRLMQMGMMVTMNQMIDFDTASIIAEEFEFEVKNVAVKDSDLLAESRGASDAENLQSRSPVVTVMGHVDHGKTSLLDRIREARVASGEAGGITQHIGAYQVERNGQIITFLDTPGHAAFTAMRARGANVTDIVILVVAADDGVMPQTKEAISHAKSAGVPIVVAINKCDKPDAKPERVMQELTEFELVPEDWGGDTMMVQVSALTGDKVDKLLEAVLLQSEVLELQADPTLTATGTVIEAQLDKGRGPVCTVLIESGTLKTGTYMVAGEHMGRIRAMIGSDGSQLKEAGPSCPVQVLGLSGVPTAGDRFDMVEKDRLAKQVAQVRAQQAREAERMKTTKISLDDFMNKKQGGDERFELKLIVKADVSGSSEALCHSLSNLSTKKVGVTIVHSGVGTITENDINLAMASDAIIIGFNAKPDAKAHKRAQREQIDVRTYSVIYEALDEVRQSMSGLLPPLREERPLGEAEVRATFSVPKLGQIAGCYVVDGKVTRECKGVVIRGGNDIHEGTVTSLKRFKDDASSVKAGFECGIGIKGFREFEVGDTIKLLEIVEVAATLDKPLVELEESKEGAAGASA